MSAAAPSPSHGVAVPAAVSIVVGAAVAVLAVVGLIVSLTSDRLPSGPAMAPPPPAAARVTIDPITRTTRYEGVAVTMPLTPYECPTSPISMRPLLASGVVCSATVHPDYRGADDWAATAGFGSVPEELNRSTPVDTAVAVFQQIQTSSFAGQQTEVTDFAVEKDSLDGHEVAIAHGNVHYSVPGVASAYDRVVVIALPVKSGGSAVYFTSRPNDTPKVALDRLNHSINTLRYGR